MIRKVVLSPPAINQNGDEYHRDGGYLNQWRNGHVVQTWNLAAMQSEPLDAAVVNGSVIDTLYLEQAMPGINASLVNVSTNPAGQVTFHFNDSSSLQYSDWASIADEADSLDAVIGFAHKLLIAKSYRNDPDGVNKANFVGGQVSVNLSADQPIVYTEPI